MYVIWEMPHSILRWNISYFDILVKLRLDLIGTFGGRWEEEVEYWGNNKDH